MKQFTRRDLPAILSGAAIALKPAAAQLPPADLLEKARQSKRAASDDLAKFNLPMATEPAFHFKA